MQSQRIAQTDFGKLLKRRALAVGTHDRSAPQLWIMNINIFRRDIEIAANHKSAIRMDLSRGEIDIFLFGQAITQSRVPFQFIFVSRRADGLAVRRVNGIDPQISDRCRNHARLRIDHFITKRHANICQFRFRKDRDAVVRFLAVISSVVTGGLQRQRRKLFVGAFRFLQTNNIGRGIFQPREQSILTFAQRIDVPGDNFH